MIVKWLELKKLVYHLPGGVPVTRARVIMRGSQLAEVAEWQTQ